MSEKMEKNDRDNLILDVDGNKLDRFCKVTLRGI